MRLYEISGKIAEIFSKIENQGGEILPDDEAALNELEIEKEEKIENTCYFIRNLQAEKEAIDNEKRRLDARSKDLANQIDWAKNYLGFCVGTGNKAQAGIFKIGWRESFAVQVQDESKVPDLFWRVKTEREIDKAILLAILKSGEEIEGVALEKRQNIQIK